MVGKEDPEILYLIDFGLSYSYLEEINVENTKKKRSMSPHKPFRQLNSFSGNFQFASIRSCQGFSKSRRDDLESILYLVIFLLNENSLPWIGNNEHANDIRKKIFERAKYKYCDEIFSIINNSNNYLKYKPTISR